MKTETLNHFLIIFRKINLKYMNFYYSKIILKSYLNLMNKIIIRLVPSYSSMKCFMKFIWYPKLTDVINDIYHSPFLIRVIVYLYIHSYIHMYIYIYTYLNIFICIFNASWNEFSSSNCT